MNKFDQIDQKLSELPDLILKWKGSTVDPVRGEIYDEIMRIRVMLERLRRECDRT